MKRHLSLAAACLVSLGLASSANAGVILNYGQTSLTDGVKTATTVGGVTTITTSSTSAPGFIPVTITALGNTSGLSLAAFEQFSGVTSTGPAVVTAGSLDQLYSGTITFYSAANVASPFFLRIAFAGADLTGQIGGNAANLTDNQPPASVVFTTQSALVTPALVGPPNSFAFGLSGLSPALGVTGTALNSFTATGEGGTASVNPIPEPATLISSGTALLAGLGCYGWRRRKSA